MGDVLAAPARVTGTDPPCRVAVGQLLPLSEDHVGSLPGMGAAVAADPHPVDGDRARLGLRGVEDQLGAVVDDHPWMDVTEVSTRCEHAVEDVAARSLAAPMLLAGAFGDVGD